MAVALASATAPTVHAVAAKDPLIGATREQVLAKYGEPKNTIVAGNREVLLFDRDRVTLRDNVVIQVERLPEPVRHAPLPEPASAAPAQTTVTPAAPNSATPAANNAPAATTTTPAPAAAATTTATPTTNPATTVAPSPATPDPNAPLEIKVRSSGSRPAAKSEPVPPAPATTTPVATPAATTPAPTENAAPAPVTPANAVAPATTPPVASTAATTPPPATSAPAESTAPKTAEAAKPAEETPAVAPAETAKADEAATTAADDKKEKAKTKKLGRRRLDDGELAEEPIFTTSTYLIGAVIIGGGLAFIVWRMRQRQLELAASAVSRTPFSAPVAASAGGGAVFTADLLGKLEWKRFEDLVAAYYSKTGVVAARTKTGPASPVQIKISWKGEPRPFALVQCISHPSGLIDATRLQELVTVLAAEDIRRGYVVTTGKFNVPARDFAEEKHITLLPGDILLEKINALPDAARNELMTEIMTGDYTTPSCPKCEAKMVRNPDDSSQWRCATHPDQVIPVK